MGKAATNGDIHRAAHGYEPTRKAAKARWRKPRLVEFTT
jgi:hypothetical protein